MLNAAYLGVMCSKNGEVVGIVSRVLFGSCRSNGLMPKKDRKPVQGVTVESAALWRGTERGLFLWGSRSHNRGNESSGREAKSAKMKNGISIECATSPWWRLQSAQFCSSQNRVAGGARCSAHNKSVKSLASSLGRSALLTCSGMASPLLPDQVLHAERRLPGRYTL